MGTRADFYVGTGLEAEWLGSIAMDGYPDGHPKVLLGAENEGEYRQRVEGILVGVKHATRPAQGWPWPWEDSRTTDYAYAWTGDGVAASCFGHQWFDPRAEEPDSEEDEPKRAVFPDMTSRQNVTYGARSGLLIFEGPPTA